MKNTTNNRTNDRIDSLPSTGSTLSVSARLHDEAHGATAAVSDDDQPQRSPPSLSFVTRSIAVARRAAALCVVAAAGGCIADADPSLADFELPDVQGRTTAPHGEDLAVLDDDTDPSASSGCGYTGVFNRLDGRIFDLDAYRQFYPALTGSDQELRDHWKNHGLAEGRSAHHSFKVQEYAANYEALLEVYTTPAGCIDFVGLAHHYLLNATRDGRYGTIAEKQANTPEPPPSTPDFVVELAPGEEVFYDYDDHYAAEPTCATRPDANIRGFIDADGLTQLTMGDVENYRFVEDAATPGVFSKDCLGPTMSSDRMQSQSPSQYRDYEWLMSTYTIDGATVHALAHNEHHYGYAEASALFNRNQKMSVTQFISVDSGYSFLPNVSNGFLLASPPEAGQVLDPINDNPSLPQPPGAPPDTTGLTNTYGFFEPSNIIRNPEDNAYYVLVHQKPDPRGGTNQGICLLRNLNVNDAGGWLAWDGTDFTVDMSGGALCQPLGNIVVMRSSLTYSTTLGEFLLIGFPLGTGATPEETEERTKLSYSHAADLRGPWSTPIPIDTSALPGKTFRAASSGGIHGYPSVIDHNIKSSNFTYSGDEPSLYITEFAVDPAGNASTARKIMRYQLEVH